MTGIDFSRSRAILVGTGTYTHGLAAMPQANNSLHAMRDLLIGPLCGWPENRVEVFEDKAGGDGVERDIAALIHATTDVLLIYYVGHGQLLNGDNLGMALVDTERDPKMRSSTSWRFHDLRLELTHRCPARVKVVLLDCCYSGLATTYTQGVSRASEAAVKGNYVLTASRASQKARHEQHENGLTYFTKYFTEVVREGTPDRGPELTLKHIHEQVAARFQGLQLPDGQIRPEPSTLVGDTAAELVFSGNAAFPRAHRSGEPGRHPARRPPTPPQRRNNALVAAVFIAVFAAVYAITYAVITGGAGAAIVVTIAGAAAATMAGAAAIIAAAVSTSRRRNALAAIAVFIAVFIAGFLTHQTGYAIIATIAATIAAVLTVTASTARPRKDLAAGIAITTAAVVFVFIAVFTAATTSVFTKPDVVLQIIAIAIVAAVYALVAAVVAVTTNAVVMAVLDAVWKAAGQRRNDRRA